MTVQQGRWQMAVRRGRRRGAKERQTAKGRWDEESPSARAGGEGYGDRGTWQNALALVLLIALVVMWWRWPAGGGSSQAYGPLDTCQRQPRFTAELGLVGSAIGTSIEGVKGLAVVDPSQPAPEGVYQHESWDDFGYLGPFTYDAEGNLYTAPVPLVSLEENPLGEQNRVLRMDTSSQVLSLLVELPPAAEPSSTNPYGVVGLAYDCETGSLYAASLAGSTAGEELGRIFQIRAADGQVLDVYEGADAMGLGVFRGSSGKRLYLGRTRSPEVQSLALDEAGGFAGDLRPEFSLTARARGGMDTARRLRFSGEAMRVHAFDFNYSLQVASEREELELDYAYDGDADAWLPIESP